MVLLDQNKRREGSLLIALQPPTFRRRGWIKAWKLSQIRGEPSDKCLTVLHQSWRFCDWKPCSNTQRLPSIGVNWLLHHTSTYTTLTRLCDWLEEEQNTVTTSTAWRLQYFSWLICWNKMALSELNGCRFDARPSGFITHSSAALLPLLSSNR